MNRTGTCRCGAVRVACEGEPVRVSICHCRACKQRSGSAFAAQVRFPEAQVTVSGETGAWVRTADSGNRVTYHFCPLCGSTAHYDVDAQPGIVAVPLGNFTEPHNYRPGFSVWESRRLDWVAISAEGIEHID
jgi:hypothetical protein